MEITLILILTFFLLSSSIYILKLKSKTSRQALEIENLLVIKDEINKKEQKIAILEQERQRLDKEKDTLLVKFELAQEHHEEKIENLKMTFAEERRTFQETKAALQKQHNDNFLLLQEQWKEKAKEMKMQFEHLAQGVLDKNTSLLKSTNSAEMANLVDPIKTQFEKFEKAMKESNVNSAKDKASLEQIIKLMMSKTEALGEEAEKLARALTTNGKTQGDFGEMVLENILEHSGLEENISYFKQKSYDIGQNKRFRPDVVVKFPENRSIIIDSKTSLTAYNNYINATNDIERKEALKAHMESVKKHIDELSEKDYTQLEDNIIGYVLMFMPNEGAYILAVNEKLKEGNQLINAAQYAYNKRVLLINPTNLMMALQLAKNLWISADQKKNIQEIVRQGTAMYEKFTGFLDDFDKIGKQISSVQMVWDAASKKLSEGKGNLVGRAEKMRLLGLDTKKQIATERVEKALEE